MRLLICTWHLLVSLATVCFVRWNRDLKIKDSRGLEEQLLSVNSVSWKTKSTELVTLALKYWSLYFRQMCRSYFEGFWWLRITVYFSELFVFPSYLKVCTFPSGCAWKIMKEPQAGKQLNQSRLKRLQFGIAEGLLTMAIVSPSVEAE